MGNSYGGGRACPLCDAEGLTVFTCPRCGIPTHLKPRTRLAVDKASTGGRTNRSWTRKLRLVSAALAVVILAWAGFGNAAKKEAAQRWEQLVMTRAGVNEPLSLKGTTYKVTAVRTADALGGERANGIFVVDLTLTNEKDRPATVLVDAIRLIGGNKSSYSVSDDALGVVDQQSVIAEQVQPHLPEQGVLVYDLPRQAVAGSELQARDLFSKDRGRINLGL